jgi:3',5'-cyclic AMP phosphodiesterase CpdA
MKNQEINRREFLTLLGLTTLALGSCKTNRTSLLQTGRNVSSSEPPQRSCRIAHMTDFHILPQDLILHRAAKAFRHVHALEDAPDFILNTGDSIMDSLKSDRINAEKQWDAFLKLIDEECRLPIFHALGNHDVWGWGDSTPGLEKDPLYGKALALKKLNLSSPYYSFDRNGWHFIVLDSTHLPNSAATEPYIGRLDETQFDWLKKDLQAVPPQTPICIASHIPILSACELFDGPNEESGNWIIPAAWVHIDARRLRNLFLKHSNIRLCLSGHSHQHERVDYLNVSYLTNGAVCGNWWMGNYMDFPPAYVLMDLYTDGSVRSTFVPYLES